MPSTSGQCSHGDSGARPWWPVYLSENPWLSWLEAVCQHLMVTDNLHWIVPKFLGCNSNSSYLKNQPDGQLSKTFSGIDALGTFWPWACEAWIKCSMVFQASCMTSSASSVMATDTWLFNLYRSVTVSSLASPSVASWLPVIIQAHSAIRMNGDMFPGLSNPSWSR